MKSLQDYDTPETDATWETCERNYPYSQGIIMKEKSESLEKRLSACREAIKWALESMDDYSYGDREVRGKARRELIKALDKIKL